MTLFPAFLKLKGRKCVVVGGGTIAAQKLEGLRAADALITLVAPSINEVVRAHIGAGAVQWIAREFRDADLDRSVLAIAATGNPQVNEVVFRAAEKRGVLCNAVDEPERCHFYYGSVVQRGDLQIAISTNGKSPALAQRLRVELETYFDQKYAEWLNWLGRVRALYIARGLPREKRVGALHNIASARVFARYREVTRG